MKPLARLAFLVISLFAFEANAQQQHLVISKDTGWRSDIYGWYYIGLTASAATSIEDSLNGSVDYIWGTSTNHDINIEIKHDVNGYSLDVVNGVCEVEYGTGIPGLQYSPLEPIFFGAMLLECHQKLTN